MRMLMTLLALLCPPLLAQTASPRFMYIYRDSLKQGVDSAYSAIEEEAAGICADLRCPNPYIGLESLNGPHEAWWLNVFATEADTARVSRAYARDRRLMEALGDVAQRKAPLIGTPVEGYAVHRRDLIREPAWSVEGARFIVVTVTKDQRPVDGVAWMMADSTLYVMHPLRTLGEAEALARSAGARIFAVRPDWSMPAPEWVAADPEFWRRAPARRTGRVEPSLPGEGGGLARSGRVEDGLVDIDGNRQVDHGEAGDDAVAAADPDHDAAAPEGPVDDAHGVALRERSRIRPRPEPDHRRRAGHGEDLVQRVSAKRAKT